MLSVGAVRGGRVPVPGGELDSAAVLLTLPRLLDSGPAFPSQTWLCFRYNYSLLCPFEKEERSMPEGFSP